MSGSGGRPLSESRSPMSVACTGFLSSPLGYKMTLAPWGLSRHMRTNARQPANERPRREGGACGGPVDRAGA